MKKILLFLSILITTAHAAPTSNLTKKHLETVLICDSNGAKVYHSYECRGLGNCKHGVLKISKAQAIKLGRRACKICY